MSNGPLMRETASALFPVDIHALMAACIFERIWDVQVANRDTSVTWDLPCRMSRAKTKTAFRLTSLSKWGSGGSRDRSASLQCDTSVK